MIPQPYQSYPEDGQEILRILESSAAKGSIELIYTRRPDAYASYQKEPGEARVFVTRDGDRLVGTAAELIRSVYIDGEIRKAAYLCGLKKDATYDGSVGFGPDLLRTMQRDDIDFYYCSVVEENRRVQRMFEKKRRILAMEPLCAYTTFIINPRVRVRAPKHALNLRQATPEDWPRLMGFYGGEGRKKDLFPVLDTATLWEGLCPESFYMLMDGNEIVAAAALWNQTAYKQYIVKRYGGLMKFARMLNPLLTSMGYISLPKEDQPLDFPTLSFFLTKNDDEGLYRIFLREILSVIRKDYSMFVIGLPELHAAMRIFQKLPHISFDTRLYSVTFPWSKQTYSRVTTENIFPECALL